MAPCGAKASLHRSAEEEGKIIWKENEIVIKKKFPTCLLCGSGENLNPVLRVCQSGITTIKTDKLKKFFFSPNKIFKTR